MFFNLFKKKTFKKKTKVWADEYPLPEFPEEFEKIRPRYRIGPYESKEFEVRKQNKKYSDTFSHVTYYDTEEYAEAMIRNMILEDFSSWESVNLVEWRKKNIPPRDYP
jgi:hypothetical protein